MSLKLDLEVNYVPGEKIIRIRRVDRQNKPVSMGIIEYSVYANEEAKAADSPLLSTSKDAPGEALNGDDVVKLAYQWLKSNVFFGATDC